MKHLLVTLKLFVLVFILTCTSAAQDNTTLQNNRSQTFSLVQNQQKVFVLDLDYLGLADVLVLANDGLNLTMSISDPDGEYVFEDVSVADSIPFVAEKKGIYRVIINLKPSAENQQIGEQKITVQYSDKLNFADKMAIKAQRKINGYDVKILETTKEDGEAFLLIEKQGKLHAVEKGNKFIAAGFFFSDDISHAYSPQDKRSAGLMKSTLDKTGDGIPDVSVEYYTGGAHCCFQISIYELGDVVTRSLDMQTADARLLATRQNPASGLRFETGDMMFRYWNIHFAGSPAPDVIFDFKDGKPFLNLEAMKKPAPTLLQLKAKAVKAKAKINLDPYNDVEGTFEEAFWGEMLDLIYTGHSEMAWQYLDLVWPVQKTGKDAFLRDFKSQLALGFYGEKLANDEKAKMKASGNTVSSKEAILASAPTPQPNIEPVVRQPVKTVSGGVLNGKAVNLVLPPYPPAARAVRAAGTVNVQVTIDEEGNVISASAVSGHPLLKQAAESAARSSKFSPTVLLDQKVKITGVIIYNFTAQ